MKSFGEMAVEDIEEVEMLDEESTGSSSMTSGVANPDGPRLGTKVKRSRFMGHEVVEVDSDTYHACVKGKMPFKRWTGYIDDEDTRSDVRKLYHRNKRLLVKDSRSGAMAFLK